MGRSSGRGARNRALVAGRTAIIITHRIFSLLQFDFIVVMEDGRIIEQGGHQELLDKDGYYADLYRRQQATDDESEDSAPSQSGRGF
jgi:ATP-binding cassette subfamily B protein